jgi:RNA polymerase sigma-70 factor (ECF subfamily)
LPGVPDHELVAKALQGNKKAFGEILERYHSTAYAVVRTVLGDRDDVEDVLQNVYIKIYRGLGGFRGDARLSTWVYQIARNEAVNAVRKRQLDVTPIDDLDLAATGRDADPDDAYGRTELGARMERALGEIDENYRMALELRYMGERSYEEIAETMGLPLGTIKTYIHRGKAELKRVLVRAGEETPRRNAER